MRDHRSARGEVVEKKAATTFLLPFWTTAQQPIFCSSSEFLPVSKKLVVLLGAARAFAARYNQMNSRLPQSR